MDRDKLIGLAMAILLIGSVTAFSFRRTPEPEPPVPQLQDPAAADEGLGERAVAPYVTGIEPIDAPAETSAQPAPIQSPTTPALASTDDPWDIDLPDFLQDETASSVPAVPTPHDAGQAQRTPQNDPAQATAAAASNSPSRPATSTTNGPPIARDAFPPVQSSTTKSSTPLKPGIASRIPSHNAAWEIASKKTEPASSGMANSTRTQSVPPGVPRVRTHVVQPGDTLSGLAIRYLGSAGRFRDLFEANRDLLDTPDALQVGMPLKIPTNGLNAAAVSAADAAAAPVHEIAPSPFTPVDAAPSTSSPVELSQPIDIPGDSVKGKFVPASRSPFRPLGTNEAAAPANHQSWAEPAATRRMTQVLPPELAGLIQTPTVAEAPQNAMTRVSATSIHDGDSTSSPTPNSGNAPLRPESSPPTTKTATAKTASPKTAASPANDPAPSAHGKSTTRQYTIRPGDSLERIAVEIYGQRSAAQRIYEANSQQLKTMNDIRAGMTITLP